MYRRHFAKVSLLAGTGVFIVPGGCADPSPSGTGANSGLILTADERLLFERFGEAYLPTEGTILKPLSEVPFVDNIDRTLQTLDPATLDEVRVAFKLFNYGSIPIGFHFAKFVNLTPPQRLEYLRGWETGGETRRAISEVMKKLFSAGYWQDVGAGKAIGFRGPVSDEWQIPKLGNAPSPTKA